MSALSAEIRAIMRAIVKYTEAKTAFAWLYKPIPRDELVPIRIDQSVAEDLKSLWVPHQLIDIPTDESFLIIAKSAAGIQCDDQCFGKLTNSIFNVEHAREIRDEIKLATAKYNHRIADLRGRLDHEMRSQVAEMRAKK